MGFGRYGADDGNNDDYDGINDGVDDDNNEVCNDDRDDNYGINYSADGR